MNKIRTFFAIPLPKNVIDELERIQDFLIKCDSSLKFVNPQNMHITMKFLGETDESMLEQTSKELSVRFKEFSKFKLRLNCNGFFPSKGNPRILWTGIGEIPRQMKQIFYFLNTYFTQYSYDESGKKLSPHITQARIKNRIDSKIINKFVLYKVNIMEFDVNKIIWFESTYINKNLTYVPLKEFFLKNS